MRFKKSSKTKGETIAETLVALGILSIGITFSGVIMANSLKNINSSKSRIIAVNIAREGVEAMRNIRDTNWLKFSGNRRNCWNHLPGTNTETNPDVCDETQPEGLNPIGIGDYIIYKDENQRWRLRAYEKTIDPDTNKVTFENSQLYFVDIDTNVDTDSDGNSTNDFDMYNHWLNVNNANIGNEDDPMGHSNSEYAPFKRVISIGYLGNNGSVAALVNPAYNRMVVTSTVTWVRNDVESSVTLKTHLTDYFGRESLGG